MSEVHAALKGLPAGVLNRLKPLYESLGGRYSFAQLCCIKAGLDT